MKRINNLYDQIASLDNLRLADLKARRGKLRSYGVLRHDRNRDANIMALHKSLIDGTYRTSPYTVFRMVTDAGKERTISRLPYFPDRILHHAVMNVLEPIWVSLFTADTYSCIKGRGIHGALRNVKKALRDQENTRYCLKLDVRQYYPSIDDEVLKKIIRRKVKDARLLALLDEVIDSTDGVPIGNYLSQFFANLYLAYFDHWMKETKRVQYYFRYADDLVVLHGDKAALHTLLADIRTYFADHLNLEIKGNHQVFPVDSRGVDFVGYVFRHSHIRLRKTIKQSFARKVARLRKRNADPEVLRHAVASYTGWAKHCDARHCVGALAV